MIANHTVKADGKWYRRGDEIPSPDTTKPQETGEYTKSKIMFMKTSDLRELAVKEGIEGDFAGSASTAELKKKLIEHFGL